MYYVCNRMMYDDSYDSDNKNEITHQESGVRSQSFIFVALPLQYQRNDSWHHSSSHWPRNCRQIQLCAHHWAARTTMYQQASKKDKALSTTLAEMERNSPEEFAEHVHNFSEECYSSDIRQHSVNVYWVYWVYDKPDVWSSHSKRFEWDIRYTVDRDNFHTFSSVQLVQFSSESVQSSQFSVPKLRCPAQGRGKARNLWDFSKISKFRTSGTRDEDNLRKTPMCREDFIDWFVNKCPRYQRHSALSYFICQCVTWTIDTDLLMIGQSQGHDNNMKKTFIPDRNQS